MFKLVCILFVNFILQSDGAFRSAYHRPGKWTFPYFNWDDSCSESYEYDSEPGYVKYYNINPYKMTYSVPIVETQPLCEGKESRINTVIIEKPKAYCKCSHTAGLCKFCRKNSKNNHAELTKVMEITDDKSGNEISLQDEEKQLKNYLNKSEFQKMNGSNKNLKATHKSQNNLQTKSIAHKNGVKMGKSAHLQTASNRKTSNVKAQSSMDKLKIHEQNSGQTQLSTAGSINLKTKLQMADTEHNLKEHEKSTKIEIMGTSLKDLSTSSAGSAVSIGSEKSFAEAAATQTSSAGSAIGSKITVKTETQAKSDLVSASSNIANDQILSKISVKNILKDDLNVGANTDSADSIIPKQPTKRNVKPIMLPNYVPLEPIAAESNLNRPKQKRQGVAKHKIFRKPSKLEYAPLQNLNKNLNSHLRTFQNVCGSKPINYDVGCQNKVVDVPKSSDEEISQIVHALQKYNTDEPINYLQHLKTAQNNINTITPTTQIVKKKSPISIYLNKIISKRCDLDDKKIPSYTVNNMGPFKENYEPESIEIYEQPEKPIMSSLAAHDSQKVNDIFPPIFKQKRVHCKNWCNNHSEESKDSTKCAVRPAFADLYGYPTHLT